MKKFYRIFIVLGIPSDKTSPGNRRKLSFYAGFRGRSFLFKPYRTRHLIFDHFFQFIHKAFLFLFITFIFL